jgi:hypothetical protein
MILVKIRPRMRMRKTPIRMPGIRATGLLTLNTKKILSTKRIRIARSIEREREKLTKIGSMTDIIDFSILALICKKII